MPLNRYGGYGGYGTGSYSSYTSSYTSSYGRAGSASPATLRATTPSRAFGSNSIINTILPEDRAYKINSYYSPGTYSRLYSGEYRDVKTIKTEELNTEEREKERHHAIPGEITRDTTLNIRGGKPVVRIVTQKAKENPYINNAGWRSKIKEEEEKNNLTLGQRLALKHQISDKPRVKEKSPTSGKSRSEKQKGESGDDDSEWTWETCSSSSQEQDGYEYTTVKNNRKNLATGISRAKSPPPSGDSSKRAPVVYSRSNTTTLCSAEDSTAIKAAPSCPPTPNSAVRNRWLDAMLSDKPKQQTSTERIPNFGAAVSMNKNILDRQLSKESDKTASNRNQSQPQSQSRPVSWAGTQPLQDVQGNVHTDKGKPKPPKSSSGSSSSSPPLYKYQPRKGAASVLVESSDEEVAEVRPGWRPGQPPRGDVVVKLTKGAKKETSSNAAVIALDHSKETKDKATNKALTSGTVISSKVPAGMNDKYNIPGLMIKPSTKEAPKSVEAKLTLSPVEGKISLTTKVNEGKSPYQSSIYTPSKSPLLESKGSSTTNTSSLIKKDPSSGVSAVSLSSVVQTVTKGGDSEESEWEYYTESEPEIDNQESKPADSQQAKTPEPNKITKESVSTTNNVQSSASKSLNIPVPATSLQIPETSKPNVAPKKVQAETVKQSASNDAGKVQEKNKAEVCKVTAPPPAKHESTKEMNVKKDQAQVTKKEVNKVVNVTSNKAVDKPTILEGTNGKAVETKAEPQNKIEQKINHIKPVAASVTQTHSAEEKLGDSEAKKKTSQEITIDKNNATKIQTNVVKANTKELASEKKSIINISSAQAQEKVKNEANKKQNESISSGPQQKQQDKQVSKVANKDKIVAASAPDPTPAQTKSVESISSPPQTDKNDLIISPNNSLKPSSVPAPSDNVSRTSSPENGMPATSLERLPSALKNMFAGNVTPKSSPENAPKWYNNTPKDDPNDPNKAIAQLKNDYNKQVRKQQKQEESLIKISDAPSDPWYEDEADDMSELLAKRPSILKEVDLNQDRRLTPEENSAVIKMYGGVMFPGGPLERTPKNLLFRIRKALGRTESMDKQQRDSGFESGLVSQRTNSTSSNSSTISSFATFSESPSPSPTHSDDDSDQYSDSDEENKRLLKNPTNQAPTKTRPEFKKYAVKDFRFLKVLGKGSFGKVLLAELRNTQNYYAVKALRKDSVLEDDDIECTMIERKALALGVKHPFLCHLFCTLQTDSHLFFVMEYLNGGDLMFHIQQSGRDLKLDNLLLDYEGHIRLVDFGMCKLQIYLDKTSDTFCGTPDYMAPEIIKGMKYTHSVDWWSFGVLLYEMLIGQSPFNGCDEDELFWSICNEAAYFPRFLSREAKHILLLLLEKNPARRLGVSDSVAGDIRQQPFFKPIDFNKLEKKQIVPPYKPKLKNPMDVSYFDTAFTDEPVKLTPIDATFLARVNQAQFKGFSYTNKQYTATAPS